MRYGGTGWLAIPSRNTESVVVEEVRDRESSAAGLNLRKRASASSISPVPALQTETRNYQCGREMRCRQDTLSCKQI